MNKMMGIVMLLSLALMVGCSGRQKAGDTADLSSDTNKISYALGFNYGKNISKLEGSLDLDSMLAGVRDAYSGSESKIPVEEIQQLMKKFQQDVYQRDQEKQKMLGSRNLEEGRKFLDANVKKPGVKVTASGLQYKVLKQGSGARPTADSKVKVHYHGTLIDGTVFDSSVERGEPISFQLKGLIPGWVEGLQLMKTGSKYRFFIPPQLGYGARGTGGPIGPNATLVFDVELLSIEK